MKRYVFAVLSAFALSFPAILLSSGLAAEPVRDPNVLFIGTSLTYYNDGVDKIMRGLAASANPATKGEIASHTVPSVTLAWQWDRGEAVEKIRGGEWDFVVLQTGEGSEVWKRNEYIESVRKFDAEIRKVGARTVLYMPWERVTGWGHIAVEDYAPTYESLAAELGARVAPVGMAWARVARERPDLNLYHRDHIHPNDKGTYLTACVFYATIYGQSPVGLSFRTADLRPDPDKASPFYKPVAENLRRMVFMSDEDVEFMQRVAWETVQDYQAQHPIAPSQ